MSVATSPMTSVLDRNGTLILEVLGEAIDASQADKAPLIASSGLPTGNHVQLLTAQIDELTSLRTRLMLRLAQHSSGAIDAHGRSELLADLLHALKAVRVAVYDLIRNGTTARMTPADVVAQCARYVELDATLREGIIPELTAFVALDGE